VLQEFNEWSQEIKVCVTRIKKMSHCNSTGGHEALTGGYDNLKSRDILFYSFIYYLVFRLKILKSEYF
jgi:hypothetical protein